MHAGVNDRRSWVACGRAARRPGIVACASTGAVSARRRTSRRTAGRRRPTRRRSSMPQACDSVVIVACSMGGAAALDFALDYPDRVEGLVLIGSAVRGAPYPEVTEEPDATLERDIEAADEAGDLDEVNRLETWMWLDGPSAEGRVQGPARDLFMEMNGARAAPARSRRARGPGEHLGSAGRDHCTGAGPGRNPRRAGRPRRRRDAARHAWVMPASSGSKGLPTCRISKATAETLDLIAGLRRRDAAGSMTPAPLAFGP